MIVLTHITLKDIRKFVVVLSLVSILPIYYYYKTLFEDKSFEYELDRKKFACGLPQLEPFHASVRRFIHNKSVLNCRDNWGRLFSTDLENNLLVIDNPKTHGLTNCCYKKFVRIIGDDNHVRYAEKCTRITEKKTKISEAYDFIGIFCLELNSNPTFFNRHGGKRKKLVDIFGFVHKKRKSTTNSNTQKMNVVILGLDSVSHMNLIRTMPKTYNYLTTNVSAIGMNGYTKVGDNTFPNLVPVLTGLSEEELIQKCWPNPHNTFDSCPFIWKNFSKEGYWTSFGEDGPGMGIFNYMKKGFNDPPTDYYLRPLVSEMERTIGNHHDVNSMVCYGSRLAFQILLDHMMKMAEGMKKLEPYFQLIWASSLFHDFLNFPRIGDDHLFSMLTWFNDNGHLENTAFVFMSDHGMRFGEFRETTKQGRLEDRMPFLYFILPRWFHMKYPNAIKEMKENTNRLSSPFDLYETLIDLLYPEKMDAQPRNRGISHFRRFSANRTCSEAGISEQWCVCNESKNKTWRSISVDDVLVQNGVTAFIEFLNSIIRGNSNLCLDLELNQILDAEILSGCVEEDLTCVDLESMRLKIQTTPGNAIFEGTLFPNADLSHWTNVGEAVRVNLYGRQSHCVQSSTLKKYCYCRNQI